jgi:NADH-quinone oxidoreductase subunit L
MLVVAIVGCATAFFAATIGLVQTDIKKVLAYSTVSQLGYMFLACGVGAFSAGIFHLMTHAFFKALLFLAAGSVIHAMGGEQDMNKMGGLSKKIRRTYLTMLTATLAIAGFPPFAGFFSKDSILLSAFQSVTGGRHIGYALYGFGLLTALLTSFYMFRLIFLTFHGKPRFDEHKVHVHESPNSMLAPLMILAVFSIVGGWFAAPAMLGTGPDYFSGFLQPLFRGGEAAGAEAEARSLELILAGVAVAVALIGALVAYWLCLKKPEKADALAKSMKPVYTTLLNKYYVDEFYAAVVVRPLLWISTNVFWKTADVAGIDGAVDGIAHGTTAIGDGVRHTQSGNTRSYAVWVVIGAIVIIAVIFFWPSAGKPVIGMVR